MTQIRISCSGLCIIRDEHARYLLKLNQNRVQGEKHVLMPLGGALKYYVPNLLAKFDARAETPEAQELRLYMDDSQIENFKVWFSRRQDRELSPFRELEEELIDEIEDKYRMFQKLEVSDVDIAYLKIISNQRQTERQGVDGDLHWTQYFNEIFDIKFLSSTKWNKLKHAVADTGLRWVTRHEIECGSTNSGMAIDATILLTDS